MRLQHTFLLSLITAILCAQDFNSLSFGTDSTLDIATWNIERFPKNSSATEYVREIILHYNFDLIAMQELDDTTAIKSMVNEMPGYSVYFRSEFFGGLAFIYKSHVIQVGDIYEIYTTSEYWNAFPRSPMFIEFNYSGLSFTLVNNHLKCCGDGILDDSDRKDEENRRLIALNLLKEYVDREKPDDRVLIVGDLNDELTDITYNNVFSEFIDDDGNYKFADIHIATASSDNWSYPQWPSHLDHILVSNEVFSDIKVSINLTSCLKVDQVFSNWEDYYNAVSDHRPVAIRISVNQSTLSTIGRLDVNEVFVWPNPFHEDLHFTLPGNIKLERVEVYNYSGKKIANLKPKQAWKPDNSIETGTYFLVFRLVSGDRIVRKVIKR